MKRSKIKSESVKAFSFVFEIIMDFPELSIEVKKLSRCEFSTTRTESLSHNSTLPNDSFELFTFHAYSYHA